MRFPTNRLTRSSLTPVPRAPVIKGPSLALEDVILRSLSLRKVQARAKMKGIVETRTACPASPAAAEAGHNLTILFGIVLLALLQRDELRLTDPGPYRPTVSTT